MKINKSCKSRQSGHIETLIYMAILGIVISVMIPVCKFLFPEAIAYIKDFLDSCGFFLKYLIISVTSIFVCAFCFIGGVFIRTMF